MTMQVPEAFRLTDDEQRELQTIRAEAVQRHERNRRSARRRGRHDFPLQPHECSWAFEVEFLQQRRR